MKKVIKKTQKERDLDENVTNEILVGGAECRYWYVVCTECNIAFFEGDKILATKNNDWKCPIVISKYIFRKRKCMRSLYGGEEKSFNKYFKFA